ncbi:MAG: hypothetical protein WD358_03540 [Nitriliruptoraceae bacterium]
MLLYAAYSSHASVLAPNWIYAHIDNDGDPDTGYIAYVVFD